MATRQRLPPPPRPPRTAGPSPRPPPPPPERSGNPGNGGCGSNSDRGQPRPPPPARPPAALGQPGPALWLGRTRALRGRQRRKPPLPLSLARKARAGGSPTQGRSLCSLLNSRRLPSLPGVPRPSSWDGRENLARDPPGPACPDERATQGWNAVPRQESPSEFQIVSAGLHPLTVHWEKTSPSSSPPPTQLLGANSSSLCLPFK
ncbi:actin nucleation-promoting factor WASL-like [Rattus norvegicus]|uniref:actin nucleation-promoting factor WASL-like n=1 Tax=Rattus norvegicus TaxID=10116 RepID=UPI001917854A|nr:neural Wiskott-Aldrich syndrome protein-like [Rattus norvegicus]